MGCRMWMVLEKGSFPWPGGRRTQRRGRKDKETMPTFSRGGFSRPQASPRPPLLLQSDKLGRRRFLRPGATLTSAPHLQLEVRGRQMVTNRVINQWQAPASDLSTLSPQTMGKKAQKWGEKIEKGNFLSWWVLHLLNQSAQRLS